MSSLRGRIYGCICPEACFLTCNLLDSAGGSIYVPEPCGECSGTSLDPSAPCLSVGYQHSKFVFNTSYKPPDLQLPTLQLLHLTSINQHRLSDRLRLGPRWRPLHQHLSQAPHVIGQSGGHHGCTREHGTLLCPAQLPGTPDPLATDGLSGINSQELQRAGL